MKPTRVIHLSLLLLLFPVLARSAEEKLEVPAYRYGALGRLSEMQGKNTEALDYFNQSLALRPDSIIYSNRADLKKKLGDFPGAIADYDKAISLNSGIGLKPADLATLHFTRGLLKQQFGDLEGSIADYDKVIGLTADSALAYNNRGYAKITKGDHTGAIEDYAKAIALQPTVIKYRDNLANARRDQGDLAGAISEYDRIVGLEPELPIHYLLRGNLKQLKDDFDGAIADYNKVIALRPMSWGGYLQRGIARQAMGDLAAAFTDYDLAVSVTQNDVPFGWAYREIVWRQLHPGIPNAKLPQIVEKWPDGLPKFIGLYLSGTLAEADFLAKSGQGAAENVSGQQCVAFYFVGMSRLLAGDKAAAGKFLQQSVATKQAATSEFVLARAELGRLAKLP